MPWKFSHKAASCWNFKKKGYDFKSKFKFKKNDTDDDHGSIKAKFFKDKFSDGLKKHWKIKKAWKKDNCDDDKDGGSKIDWKKASKDCWKDAVKDHWKKCGDKKPWKKLCDDKLPETPEPPLPPVCELPEEPENAAPVITGPDGMIPVGLFSAGLVVADVDATDADGDTLVFSINDASNANSPDADLFTIDPETGAITANAPLGFDGSADGDESYQIEVMVSDGDLSDTMILNLTSFMSA